MSKYAKIFTINNLNFNSIIIKQLKYIICILGISYGSTKKYIHMHKNPRSSYIVAFNLKIRIITLSI